MIILLLYYFYIIAVTEQTNHHIREIINKFDVIKSKSKTNKLMENLLFYIIESVIQLTDERRSMYHYLLLLITFSNIVSLDTKSVTFKICCEQFGAFFLIENMFS